MAAMARRVRKAVIPAAGMGTRFLPATKAQPKEMLPVVDKPAIQYVVEEAVQAGIRDILIVTGRGKRAIEDHFDRTPELEAVLEQRGEEGLLREVRGLSEMANLHYVRQVSPFGLGHAVACAAPFVGEEPFAVLLGDDLIVGGDPAIGRMVSLFLEHGASVLAVERVPRESVSAYGVVKVEPLGPGLYRVLDLVEKPSPEEAPSDLAIVGRYVLEPLIFSFLQHVSPGKGGEIQLTDGLRLLVRSRPVLAWEVEGVRYDIGEKLGYIRAIIEVALHRPDTGPALRAYLKGVMDEVSSPAV